MGRRSSRPPRAGSRSHCGHPQSALRSLRAAATAPPATELSDSGSAWVTSPIARSASPSAHASFAGTSEPVTAAARVVGQLGRASERRRRSTVRATGLRSSSRSLKRVGDLAVGRQRSQRSVPDASILVLAVSPARRPARRGLGVSGLRWPRASGRLEPGDAETRCAHRRSPRFPPAAPHPGNRPAVRSRQRLSARH